MVDSRQITALLHLTDSAFPTGAFSHSYGLETYTQATSVHDANTLTDFLVQRLEAMTRFDLLLMREAMTCDIEALAQLDHQLTAMLTAYEIRMASITVGKRFLKAAVPLYGEETAKQYQQAILSKDLAGHYVLAFGVLAADLGIPAEATLSAYAQAFIQGQAAAAMKLINIGQTAAQHVVRTVQPSIASAVERSGSYTLDDLHMFAPNYDIHTMQHEYLFRRLFIS